MSKNPIKYLLAVLILVGGTSSVSAATVTLVGSTINYQYDTIDNAAALLLFGAPSISGDVVRFLPPNFKAESLNGAGAVSVSGNFVFERVYSKNGDDLVQVQVAEFGDYEITTGDSVGAGLLLTGSNNNDFTEFTSDLVEFDASGDSGGQDTWLLNSSINPLVAFGTPANDIALSVQNTLDASTSANGEHAWIQKKLSLVVTTVPVPAAVWLFGSALGLLGAIRHRRRVA